MNTREFIASLIDSLAWPLGLFAIALLFRRQIVALMGEGLERVKFGLFEAAWNRGRKTIPPSVQATQSLRQPDSATMETAAVSPRTAILERYDEIIRQLGEAVAARLGEQPEGLSYGGLIDVAKDDGMIDAGTHHALVGMTVLRNLTAHGPERDIGAQKVAEFLAMADATEYAMNHWLNHPPTGGFPTPA